MCLYDYLHQCVVSVVSFSPTSSPLFYAPCKTVTHTLTYLFISPFFKRTQHMRMFNVTVGDLEISDQKLSAETHYMAVNHPPV